MRFMAGGWGAGKTYALEREHIVRPELAWDSTLNDAKVARQMVELALKFKWRVAIEYVFRDIELALYGVVSRAKSEGRSVPLAQLAKNHRTVQRSILQLIKAYREERRVSFLLLHNTGVEGVTGKSLVVRETELAPNGALHYSKRHEDYYAEAAREIQALNPAQG